MYIFNITELFGNSRLYNFYEVLQVAHLFLFPPNESGMPEFQQ